MAHLNSLHDRAISAPESGIVEVVNYGRQKEGLIPLWVGEGDLATPKFICDAAHQALLDGDTFYTWQRGVPEMRQALADYHKRLYQRNFLPDRFFVTGSGMQAIQLCIQAISGHDDEVIIPTPAWPNFSAALEVSGGRAVAVPMQFSLDGWTLDFDRITSAITDRTRAIFLNSPSNPTGWVATREDLSDILRIARDRGLWIVADEVYGQFYFRQDAKRAPSFYDIMEPEDRILFVNTMSKNWSMTGWRVGWISAPAELGQVFENLIQYSTSGVAPFMQQAAATALNEGDFFVREQVERAQHGRTLFLNILRKSNRVRLAEPDGAFYLFLAFEGENDSTQAAKRIVDEANIGLAPGSAFGSAGEGYLRLCFARQHAELEQAAHRLSRWLSD
ncbi:MAG: pyridoxal phosphate-dependent aminotransferase [Stappiaceae bacterium]